MEYPGHGLDLLGSIYGPMVGAYECGNEVSVFIKYGEFVE